MLSSFQVVHPAALFEREKKTETETEWKKRYIQISSVTQSCLTLCDPMDCSMPGFPIHHQFREFTQTHVHSFGVAILPSHPLSTPSPPTFNLSQHQGLFKCQFFVSGAQSIEVSASASVLPMNIQDWSPLGLTGWISLQSQGLSRVSSNTTVQKHQFFSSQLTLWSSSHIHTWLLEKTTSLTRWTFVGKVMRYITLMRVMRDILP